MSRVRQRVPIKSWHHRLSYRKCRKYMAHPRNWSISINDRKYQKRKFWQCNTVLMCVSNHLYLRVEVTLRFYWYMWVLCWDHMWGQIFQQLLINRHAHSDLRLSCLKWLWYWSAMLSVLFSYAMESIPRQMEPIKQSPHLFSDSKGRKCKAYSRNW